MKRGMPEAACQVYWHETPVPLCPWGDPEKLPPTRDEKKDPQHGTALQDDHSSHATRIDVDLTPLKALSELFESLGAPLLSIAELRSEVEKVTAAGLEQAEDGNDVPDQPRKRKERRRKRKDGTFRERPAQPDATLAELPLEVVVDQLCEKRGLRTRVLTVEEVSALDRRAGGAAISPGHSALILMDARRSDQFAVVFGSVARKAKENCMLDILCPIRNPLPFRLHITKVWGGLNECRVLLVERDDETPLEQLPSRLQQGPESQSHSKSFNLDEVKMIVRKKEHEIEGEYLVRVKEVYERLRKVTTHNNKVTQQQLQARIADSSNRAPDNSVELFEELVAVQGGAIPAQFASTLKRQRRDVQYPWYLRLIKHKSGRDLLMERARTVLERLQAAENDDVDW